MGFVVVAVVLGIVLGFAAGGRPANVGLRPLRGHVLLLAAIALQALPWMADIGDTAGTVSILVSYALLAGFAVLNLRLVGMPVVLVGLLCNVVVIAANGGMPVRAEAVLAVDRQADLAAVDLDAKRHLEGPDDRLTFLGDVVPLRPLGQVLSFGDLILGVGMADVAFRLLKPHAAVRRRRRRTVAEVMALLPAPAVTDLPRSA